MKYTKNILSLIVLLSNVNVNALDKKIQEGSEKIVENNRSIELATQYMSAINEKNTSKIVNLMSENSLKCFKESKHPEYYDQEFKTLFKSNLKSLSEIRKYTNYDHKFHELMKYPVHPTHIMIFNSELQSGAKFYKGWQSMEVIESQGKFFLLFRCL